MTIKIIHDNGEHDCKWLSIYMSMRIILQTLPNLVLNYIFAFFQRDLTSLADGKAPELQNC